MLRSYLYEAANVLLTRVAMGHVKLAIGKGHNGTRHLEGAAADFYALILMSPRLLRRICSQAK
jgi:hypothetical protein